MADNAVFRLLASLSDNSSSGSCANRCLSGCIIWHLTTHLGANSFRVPGRSFFDLFWGSIFSGFGGLIWGRKSVKHLMFSGFVFGYIWDLVFVDLLLQLGVLFGVGWGSFRQILNY